uniref:Uncharacterized protein n=1 Tax=Anguilla anguilla TaxID=7936 RepID=A0A0E9U6L4_ANGAN
MCVWSVAQQTTATTECSVPVHRWLKLHN